MTSFDTGEPQICSSDPECVLPDNHGGRCQSEEPCVASCADPDGFRHECIWDEGHEAMHECVCQLMWDDVSNPQATTTPENVETST